MQIISYSPLNMSTSIQEKGVLVQTSELSPEPAAESCTLKSIDEIRRVMEEDVDNALSPTERSERQDELSRFDEWYTQMPEMVGC